MTALLRKPSELEVENNDYRAEDVIQKVKEQKLVRLAHLNEMPSLCGS